MLTRSIGWVLALGLAFSAWGCAEGYSAGTSTGTNDVPVGTSFVTPAAASGAAGASGPAIGSAGAAVTASENAGSGAVSSTGASAGDDSNADACENIECTSRLQCVLRRANRDCDFSECSDGFCR